MMIVDDSNLRNDNSDRKPNIPSYILHNWNSIFYSHTIYLLTETIIYILKQVFKLSYRVLPGTLKGASGTITICMVPAIM